MVCQCVCSHRSHFGQVTLKCRFWGRSTRILQLLLNVTGSRSGVPFHNLEAPTLRTFRHLCRPKASQTGLGGSGTLVFFHNALANNDLGNTKWKPDCGIRHFLSLPASIYPVSDRNHNFFGLRHNRHTFSRRDHAPGATGPPRGLIRTIKLVQCH